MSQYPYDPDVRAWVAELLYRGMPAYFRGEDVPPSGRGELKALLQVLAAPLAVARQSIEELHADLFIDTADDWVLRYLAEMVGTTLIFPDAQSNRLDIRSTVAFRRRKGTPLMLQDMGETLTGQMVVTQEGWQLVQMTQDLNLLRPLRVLPDIRDAIIAETDAGPLCATHHLPDLRAIGLNTGVFHPKHVAHWAHPTQLFPLEEGYPADLRDPVTDPDFRFAFHPLGWFGELRVRRTGSADREIRTDRVPPMHFAATPGTWFGKAGRFNVRIAGITAAIAQPEEQGRIPSTQVAGPEIADGTMTMALREHDPRRFYATFRVQVVMVPLVADVPDTAGALDVRAQFEISAAGAANFSVVNNAAVDPARVPMLRVQPVAGGAAFFPGAVIEIAGGTSGGLLPVEEAESARRGFLRGALPVRIPATPVNGDRWLLLSLDGSCYEAQSTGTGAADVAVPLTNGVRAIPRQRLLQQSPGAAWPPLPPQAEPDPMTRVPSAHSRGPVVMHGGRVLVPGFADIGAGEDCALVFALRVGLNVPQYHPFLRLAWTGPSPAGATWSAVEDDGSATALNARWEEIAALRQARIDECRLLVRFECSRADARMAPCEIAWNSFDGEGTLLYMPVQVVGAVNPLPGWQVTLAGIGPAIAVASDGSTWDENLAATLRQSAGNIAPLAEGRTLRRRVVRQRRLCGWTNEVPPGQMLEATPEGVLDVDVENGLFSLAGTEAIRPWPAGPAPGPVPPSVTVSYQEGYTDTIGARPIAREPLLDARLATPTRIVSGSGRLHAGAPSNWFALPRYRTLTAALNAIGAAPAVDEVVQIEDSFTYSGENLVWPAGVRTLTIQAAELERPVVSVTSVAGNPAYDEFTLIGVALTAPANGTLNLPRAAGYRMLACSVLRAGLTLRFDLTGAAEEDKIEIVRSLTGPLRLDGGGALKAVDSVIDAGIAQALTATQGEIHLERCTVLGEVTCRVLHASESILSRRATVTDRFHGCVRYSRVTSNSVLPRIHRVARDTPLRFVSLDRHNPAHARLSPDADRAVLNGAEDGGEMGAFHDFRLALRYEGYRRRLEESTPAGLYTGIIRLD